MSDISQTLANLVFRRQFLLGTSAFSPTAHWKNLPLDQHLFLSVHPDLDVVSYSTHKGSVTLLGFVIDPFNPSSTSEEIIQILAEKTSNLSDLLVQCESLSGRWVLIYQYHGEIIIFTDPCGFRQIFYCTNDSGPWCGSQPEIMKACIGLEREDDEELLEFMTDPDFARRESAWVGTRTPYKGCYHLLPNHYLNFKSSKQIRFFPVSKLEQKALVEIVEIATDILKGSFAAMAKRGDLMMPVTSGWDSRVLLAASRNFSSRIEYYIDRKGTISENHPDVWVPRRIAKRMGINFVIKNSREDLPGWFVGMLAGNVTGARVLPKTRMMYGNFMAQETRINISGNGSEICRTFFETYNYLNTHQPTIDDLVRCLSQSGGKFAKNEVQKWQADFLSSGTGDFNIIDMLYWEQRLGNWGAQYSAEQDIVIEEFCPFNCRLLITTLLSAPRELRIKPNYLLYRYLIEAMWPELLTFPLNPAPKIGLDREHILLFWKEQVRPYVPRSLLNWLRYRGIL
jgi:hypothetical protein